MNWIAFCYSLPSKEGSSPRVALWRRLRRLGALSIAGGVQILPAREECVEAFHWLSQEMRTTSGEAVIMQVTGFEGLTDQQVVALFCAARAEDYHHVETHAADLRKNLAYNKEKEATQAREALARLRKRYADITRIDYFECQERRRVALILDDIERSLSTVVPGNPSIPHVDIAQYRDKRWVTRPHPYVDRLACAWLIRHFINTQAAIRYSNQVRKDEVAFDMNQGEFGHRGNLCTFETMRLAFGLESPELHAISEIVHEIDLNDDRYAWPETIGVERLLDGWLLAGSSDDELESKGVFLFEGLYAAFSKSLQTGK
jgi:hypothetical protein